MLGDHRLPFRLYAAECCALANVEADDDKVGVQESVVLWAGGVVEFEAVVPVIEANVEDEGLVYVAELGELVRGKSVGR